MEINIYQPCPCHVEKKIKFCCGKELVADLIEVASLAEARQTQAALDHIQRSLRRHGSRDCLDMLQVQLLIGAKQWDTASQINRAMLQRGPNPIASQQSALIHLAAQRFQEAIDALQDAMDQIPADEVPVAAGPAFSAVGIMLCMRGCPMAARFHWAFATKLCPLEPHEVQFINEMLRDPSINILVQHDYRLESPPEHAQWADSYEQIQSLFARARWRTALKKIDKLLEHSPGESLLVRGRAIALTILGDHGQAAQAWQQWSELQDVSFWDGAEAQALAWVLSDRMTRLSFPVISRAWAIEDVGRLRERCEEHPQFILATGDSAEHQNSTDCKFAILQDSPLSPDEDHRDESSATLRQIPFVVAELHVRSAADDQPATATLRTTCHRLERLTDFVKQHLGDLLGDAQGDHQTGQYSPLVDLEQPLLHTQGRNTMWARETLARNVAHYLLQHEWPAIARDIVREVLPDREPDDRVHQQHLAAVAVYVLGRFGRRLPIGLNYFVEHWQVNPLDQFDVSDQAPIDYTPVRWMRVNPQQLADNQLLLAQLSATHLNLLCLREAFAKETLRRQRFGSPLVEAQCYYELAIVAEDQEAALHHFQQAQKTLAEHGQSATKYMVPELAYRLSRQIKPGTLELLQQVGRSLEHQSDQAVATEFFRVLDSAGMLADDGNLVVPAWLAPESAAQGSPAGAEAAAAQGESPRMAQERSRLWLPGDP